MSGRRGGEVWETHRGNVVVGVDEANVTRDDDLCYVVFLETGRGSGYWLPRVSWDDPELNCVRLV